MDLEEKDWKKKLGFPINYDSGQSSEEDTDSKDVVMRHPRQSSRYLLEENGDGTEADLLGTTPPRARIRDKEKRRNVFEAGLSVQKTLVEGRNFNDMSSPSPPERLKKRSSLKLIRTKERDWKDGQRESRADSLPSPNPQAAVPTLVESCSRFMSLTSRLKCRAAYENEIQERCSDEELPASRVNFHNTFSMLINMGNIEKGCRRTISREEQVWQNELKDLIWLELKAKLAGRTLSQQDAYLCAQRNIIPSVVQRILEYKFVNPDPCRNTSQKFAVDDSDEEQPERAEDTAGDDDGEGAGAGRAWAGCAAVACGRCARAVGAAMRDVAALLDAHAAALALYPSGAAAAADHPALGGAALAHRLRALCLWYSTALHMRLKVLSVRRMLRTAQGKARALAAGRKSSVTRSPGQVRFNVSNNTSDSNNSDTSGHSEGKEPGTEERRDGDVQTLDSNNLENVSSDKGEEEKVESKTDLDVEPKGLDVPDGAPAAGPYSSAESGYTSEAERAAPPDVFELGPLGDVARLRLLGRSAVSAYRDYHHEMLKTQGVRRCLMFMNKMCSKLLNKVYLTLLEPQADSGEEDMSEVFEDTKETEQKADVNQDAINEYELRRYGCWSKETLAMRLPSYRNHFLLLTSISMEAVHDYLSLRMESRPENPSCLTIKQLIHELKEGLDISAEVRASFARNVQAALGGDMPGALRQLLHTYDGTVATALQQYLSYLRIMSEKESLSRAQLAGEWAFTQRLAARAPPAAALAPAAFADMACNQLNRVLNRFEEQFAEVMELEKSDPSDLDDQRYLVYTLCRQTQCIYAGSRDAALQAAHWARALAARLAPPLRADIFNSLMAIRDCLVRHTAVILKSSRSALLSTELPRDLRDSLGARVRELLLQVYKLGFELHTELHKFAQAPFKDQLERRVRRQRPSSLQPSRPQTPRLRRKRPETMLIHESINPIHKELHRFVNSSSPRPAFPRPSATGSPRRMKFLRSESIGEEVEPSALDESGFDVTGAAAEAEAEAAASAEACAGRAARAVVQFARCWMSFVVERCERGRGLRPRWASQGLEFLMLACDPYNTKHLSDEEFEELKQQMDGCISHVVGSRAAAASQPAAPLRQRHRVHSPLSSTSSTNSKEGATPPTPPSEIDAPLILHSLDDAAHRKRIVEALRQLDECRDAKLQSSRAVGRVLESTVKSYEPKLRQLTFKWQRGLKIGAGTFGKVYTVVNTQSGQLLAMKELSVAAGDRRALQRAANELRVLEGVLHPHLVRYYGCELHREEMLLFMELCVEGSLETLVAASGALAEPTARRYSKQLLSAVAELHARSIAHRDIKSGNIFLTNDGHCLKLGDFGCAVKIRANTTAPGELQGFVGTQAYMAPEVFMKSSGHGRAADIWSLGCVVTEMASGKRPFSEYDSNYQIMFVVGMGGRPHIPETLSEEGQQFCLSCLTHDPDLRPRAEALSLHHFLMVKSDDDCKCENAFLIT
ncbi:mitogen-activated protein kinase kinase kinase 4 isoform X2 [Nymphalis io]|uniref:mitogen-activated protein kinase kinase kinase 4 isoform X2 n=1 Tax=Inachis io TaxID=171585 RepID=UPI0021675715|nr:mitogen-activated protein kinase kinase kinase 4 isoform X2 [Nymphalis io]